FAKEFSIPKESLIFSNGWVTKYKKRNVLRKNIMHSETAKPKGPEEPEGPKVPKEPKVPEGPKVPEKNLRKGRKEDLEEGLEEVPRKEGPKEDPKEGSEKVPEEDLKKRPENELEDVISEIDDIDMLAEDFLIKNNPGVQELISNIEEYTHLIDQLVITKNVLTDERIVEM
ncbi:2962_t:CDS:2, partial [Gigaspora margarita]